MSRYSHPAIRQLTEQLTRFSPLDVRVLQMDRAEQLVTELDEAIEYKYPDLVEKITGYRSETYPDLRIDGTTAVHDIRLLVEDLSASANLPVDQAGELVLTVEDLSKVERGSLDRCEFARRLQIENRRAFVAELRSLKRSWQERIAPIRRAAQAPDLVEQHKAGQVLVE